MNIMYKIGVRGHDVGKYNVKELSNEIKSFGFRGVQLVFKKALINQSYDNLDRFKDFHVDIYMLGAYFNPVHPNKDEVVKGINYFKDMLSIQNKLNASYVGTESGSLMGSPWGYMKENHTDETFETLFPVFEDLLNHAKKVNGKIAIEGAWNHVLYSPKRVNEFVRRLNSDNLFVTVDLYNFLNINNYKDQNKIFDEALSLMKDKIKIIHFKDYIVEDGKLKQVGLGQGLMDYPYLIKKIKKELPDVYMIFEGVKREDLKLSLKYIKTLWEDIK